jgi:hypothetical protein
MKKLIKTILSLLLIIVNYNILLAQNNNDFVKCTIDNLAKLEHSNMKILGSVNNNTAKKYFEKPIIETPILGNYLYAYPPYPIPAKEFVSTLIFWDSKLDINKAIMCVYDMNGNKICGKENITLEKQSEFSGIVTWKTSGVYKGIYFIQIVHGTQTKMIKIIKE